MESCVFSDELRCDLEDTLNKLREGGLEIDSVNIDITEDLYKDFYEQKRSELEDPNFVYLYTASVAEQEEREANLVQQFDKCDNGVCTKEQMSDRVSNLNLASFGKLLKEDFFNVNMINIMSCIINSSYLSYTGNIVENNDVIRSKFSGLKIMGQPSVSGYAISSDFGSNVDAKRNLHDSLIIKAVRDSTKSNELIHEVFCGLSVLNNLREVMPNFAAVIGTFKCSSPLNDPVDEKNPKGKNIATFCSTCDEENDVTYAIYENIQPSIDFSKLVETCDGETFMQYYFAVLCALHKASTICDFTHYDLHDQNLLLRSCTDSRYLKAVKNKKDKSFYVPYDLVSDEGVIITFYVKSMEYIPTIIDYGRSHIVYDGKHYGMTGKDSVYYIDQNIMQKKSNILYDAFKLLGMSLSTAYEAKNFRLIAEMGPLLRHFEISEFNIHHIAKDRQGQKNYYMLPLPSDVTDINILIDFCKTYSEAMNWDVCTEIKPEDKFILTPGTKSNEEILENIEYELVKPHTFLELHELLNKNEDNLWGGSIDEEEIMYHFLQNDIKKAITYELDTIIKAIVKYVSDQKSVENSVNNFRDITGLILRNTKKYIYPSNISLYFDDTTFKSIKYNIGKLSQLSDLLQKLLVSVKVIGFVYNLLKTNRAHKASVDKIKKIHDYFISILETLKETILDLDDNLNNFIRVFKRPTKRGQALDLYNQYYKEASNSEDYEWYYNTINTLPSLFKTVVDYYNK